MLKTQARRIALQLLYEKLSGGQYDDESVQLVLSQMPEEVREDSLSRSDKRFLFGLLNGIDERQQEYRSVIAAHLSPTWTLERLSRVDICILMLAMEELHSKNTPIPIVISEAMKMADSFSDPKNKPFLNALLGAYARQKAAEAEENSQTKSV